MFYNQNFDNSYNFDSRKNNNKEENHDCKKGYCTVKVIQECCYPSYWDYEEDKKDNCKHDDRDNCHERKNDNCCCNHFDKKDDHKDCCCKKEDKWEDKNSCNYNKEDNACKQKRCCGLCSCFRRW